MGTTKERPKEKGNRNISVYPEHYAQSCRIELNYNEVRQNQMARAWSFVKHQVTRIFPAESLAASARCADCLSVTWSYNDVTRLSS